MHYIAFSLSQTKKETQVILGKAYDLHEAGPRLSDDSLSPILVYLQCRGF